MTTIASDERFKGGIHGLLLGCVLPVLAFNVVRRHKVNSVVYASLVLLELWHIAGHLKSAKTQAE